MLLFKSAMVHPIVVGVTGLTGHLRSYKNSNIDVFLVHRHGWEPILPYLDHVFMKCQGRVIFFLSEGGLFCTS